MDADTLRSLQAPLKDRYRHTRDSARITLRAQGRVGEGLTCNVETARALVDAGLHPGTGGSGHSACRGARVGPEYPRQIVNTTDRPLEYRSISTMEQPEIGEYPDSGKLLAESSRNSATPFEVIDRRGKSLDYWDGEP